MQETGLLICVMNLIEVGDSWRIYNPDTRKYTWRQYNTLKQSTLDFFLVSSELNSKVIDCDIKPGYRTDHSLIDIKFDFKIAIKYII